MQDATPKAQATRLCTPSLQQVPTQDTAPQPPPPHPIDTISPLYAYMSPWTCSQLPMQYATLPHPQGQRQEAAVRERETQGLHLQQQLEQ